MADDRYLEGYISATTAHAIGPQVEAKEAKNKQVKTIMMAPMVGSLEPSALVRRKCPRDA